MVQIYPDNPVQRLVNTKIPSADVADLHNPILQRVLQLPEFGSGSGCTPQMAGVKLREAFAHIPAPHLAQDVAHAKRWIKEKITAYIDGELIVFLRKPKYVVDVIRIIQYAARLIATLNYIRSLLIKEVELANAWALECDALVSFAAATISPAGLRNQAEQVLIGELDVAAQAIGQQAEENSAHVACLI
ncbi:MAG TPA: hypothetical protein VF747_08225 [Blastocatellia bacterium]|jgi:hypothetical protein